MINQQSIGVNIASQINGQALLEHKIVEKGKSSGYFTGFPLND
jgi:hypothetical protein